MPLRTMTRSEGQSPERGGSVPEADQGRIDPGGIARMYNPGPVRAMQVGLPRSSRRAPVRRSMRRSSREA
jgi:hypothetical protein